MRTLKTILAILLIIGAFGSLISLFEQIESYDLSETIGHLIAIILISYVAYLLLKPTKN
jgi:hypothetical protein